MQKYGGMSSERVYKVYSVYGVYEGLVGMWIALKGFEGFYFSIIRKNEHVLSCNL